MSDTAALQSWRHRARGAGSRPRRPSLKAAFAAAGVGLLVATVGGGRAVNSEQGAAAHAPPTTVALPRCPTVTLPLHADLDGDGCEEGVAFADGVLTAGPVRMRLGAPGDQVAVGRWTCSAATVALVRPATGEVFRFDGWATAGNSATAGVIGRVEGAVGVRAAPREGGRCDDLAVIRDTGPPVLLPERPVAG